MIATAIKTARIKRGQRSIIEVIDKYVPEMEEGSILAVTSKVVSLCENRTVDFNDKSLEELIKEESQLFMPSRGNDYTHSFTITNSTLAVRAGIDKSSKHGYYILWPAGPQKTADDIRRFLVEKFGLKDIGVVITDSTSTPLRYGVTGMCLAHSGFAALKKYKYSNANISGGLAAAATLVMGEGSEQTPLAVIQDVPFVNFQGRDPTEAELAEVRLNVETDYFAFALKDLPWEKGQK